MAVFVFLKTLLLTHGTLPGVPILGGPHSLTFGRDKTESTNVNALREPEEDQDGVQGGGCTNTRQLGFFWGAPRSHSRAGSQALGREVA